jgi:hypothetical protein
MRSLALAVAALMMLASCSDDPEPIEPTASPTTPALSEPSMPAKAKADTPSGAATFVGFWVSTFNYAAQTGDADPMRQNARDCKPCMEYADEFQSLPDADRPKKPPWTLKEVSVQPSRKPIEVVTTVEVLDEQRAYPLTFVLNSGAPYELVDIYERNAS